MANPLDIVYSRKSSDGTAFNEKVLTPIPGYFIMCGPCGDLTTNMSTDGFPITASYALYSIGSDFAVLAGNAITATSSSYALSASWAPSGGGASLGTGSTYPFTASFAVSASYAPSAATNVPNSITQSWMNIPIESLMPSAFFNSSSVSSSYPGNIIAPLGVFTSFSGSSAPYMMYQYLHMPYLASAGGKDTVFTTYQFITPSNYKNAMTCSFGYIQLGPFASPHKVYWEVNLFALTTQTFPSSVVSRSLLVNSFDITASSTNAFGDVSTTTPTGNTPCNSFVTASFLDTNGYIQSGTTLFLNINRKSVSGASSEYPYAVGLITAQLTWNVS